MRLGFKGVQRLAAFPGEAALPWFQVLYQFYRIEHGLQATRLRIRTPLNLPGLFPSPVVDV